MAALVVMAGACHSCGRETVNLDSYAAKESALKDTEAGNSQPDEDGGSKSVKETAGPVCYVHICGAVAKPGVYEVAKGQRIYQVVELAGGYTQEAATDYLNLAAEVADGMKLVVPTRKELLLESGESLYGTLEPQEAEKGRVNLNTATREQLMGLSGIGEARAADIIRYREEHGGFRKIEDIKKVPGIKDAAFQKIKDEITV